MCGVYFYFSDCADYCLLPHQDPDEQEQAQPQARFYPKSEFDLRRLREVFKENKVEFGRREIALRLIHLKNSRVSINQRLRDLGANILFQEQYDEISQLNNKARYLLNFDTLKIEFNREMPEWHPNPIPLDGDFLQWWDNEVKLSGGERILQGIKDRSGHLTHKAAVIFRHIYYGHNIAKSKIASLANIFGALYYDRPLKDKETVSTRTIDNHMKKLDEFDAYTISETFKKTFVDSKDQLYGFLRLWYLSTDDTKQ